MVDLSELIKRAIKPPQTKVKNAREVPEEKVGDNDPSNRLSVRHKRKRNEITSSEVEEDPIIAILDYCSDHPEEYDSVWHYLSAELFKNSSVARIKTLHIIDALFHSSQDFRRVVNKSIDAVARCGGLLRTLSNQSIAHEAAHDHAEQVTARVLELLALWDHVYGNHLPQLHALTRYLRESERVKLPNIATALKRLKQQRQEEERTRQRKVFLRSAQVMQEVDEVLFRAAKCMDAMDQCLLILFPPLPELEGTEEVPTEDEAGAEDVQWQSDDIPAGLSDDPLLGATPFTLVCVNGLKSCMWLSCRFR